MYQYQMPYMAQTPQTQPNIFNQQQNVLPQQQVIQVNGKSSVDALRMAPNSSVLLMDTTAPMVWLCVSDGLGNVTSQPYDISKHQDKPQVDINTLEQRIANIEAKLEAKNDKSYDANAKQQRSPNKEHQSN